MAAVLLTGASGFVGIHVTRQLLDLGHQVRAFVRAPDKLRTNLASHLWLNDVLAVGEGTIDVEHGQLAMRYYECRVELPLAHFAS